MKPATLEFLRQRFTQYYKTTTLVVPSALNQREWGFVLFSQGYPEIRMRRHIGFSAKDELVEYIRNLVPAHVYYSSAYYAKPDAGTMSEKGWLGADLIFDLDADHLVRGPYHLMLARVKEETEKLLAMLTGEFGIDPKRIEVVFSGGRGYHVHVRDIAIRGWGSAERRELIDYVCGIGIDPQAMLSGRVPSAKSWRSRYRQALVSYLEWLGVLSGEEALAHLTGIPGLGRDSAASLLRRREAIIAEVTHHPSPILLKNRALYAIVNAQEGEFRERLIRTAALADEPVTTDTKRLIRLPTSLHGGTGMRVQPVEIHSLAGFDPLVDAVVFSSRGIRIELHQAVTMPMLGSTYELPKGITTVPESLAVFLCCRGIAEIV